MLFTKFINFRYFALAVAIWACRVTSVCRTFSPDSDCSTFLLCCTSQTRNSPASRSSNHTETYAFRVRKKLKNIYKIFLRVNFCFMKNVPIWEFTTALIRWVPILSFPFAFLKMYDSYLCPIFMTHIYDSFL